MSAGHRILLTGVSGYVGGRLVHKLVEEGYEVRGLARRPLLVKDKVPPGVELFRGDVLDLSTLRNAMQGVHTAYYLVHAMAQAKGFEESERQGAENFARIAKEAGVQRIIYLGGLGEVRSQLSAHLRSRQEVGRILKGSGAQVLEFRASIVIGSGSLSFEMVRSLTERLPVMTTPNWVRTAAQPIGIEDLLRYLTRALHLPLGESRIIEVGGKDVVAYSDLIKEYARQRGLKRFLIPVPLLSPGLSSLWLGVVTPLYARVGHKLITSLKNPTVVKDPSGMALFNFEPVGTPEAIRLALASEEKSLANRITDTRVARIPLPPEKAFAPIQRIGGSSGWYFGNWLWRLRGFIDRMAGGPGLRRGRRHETEVRVGDHIDFWRVESFEAGRRIRLCAEMRLPGRAWLEFTVEPEGEGAVVRQTAVFDPTGVAGRLYWYLLYPLHYFVFRGMLAGIVRAAKGEPWQNTPKPKPLVSV